MSDREKTLPRWAQVALANERQRADRAERRLAEHLETVEPSGIWYGDWENKIYIPDRYGQTVYFSVTGAPAKHSRDEIGVGMRYGRLHVNASRSVLVSPMASNCFDVLVEGK